MDTRGSILKTGTIPIRHGDKTENFSLTFEFQDDYVVIILMYRKKRYIFHVSTSEMFRIGKFIMQQGIGACFKAMHGGRLPK